MATYSHSKIGSFETCQDTVETYLGIRVHEALEKLYRDLRFAKRLSLEELLAFYRESWEKNWKDSIILVKKEYTPENYREMGEKQLADYYRRYHPFDQGRVIGLETQDFLTLDEDGKYRFHVRIDRLVDAGEGRYEVHDYKTGNTLPKQEDLDRDRQLAMYSLWVRKNFKDFRSARLVWHYLAFDKEMDSFRTAEELEELRKEVLAKIKEIEAAREYPARVSWLCDWCLYKSLCPMWRHGVELEAKPENEYLNDPGKKLVDTYVRIKRELDEHRRKAEAELGKLKEALIAFCRRENVDVVFGSENKVTVKKTAAIRLPGKNTQERAALVRALEELGRLKEVSDIDVHALARILDKEEWGKEEMEKLEGLWSREDTYRLSVSKFEPEREASETRRPGPKAGGEGEEAEG